MPIPMILLMAGMILGGVFVIILGSKPQKQQQAGAQKLYKKAYKHLSSFFLTQGQMLKITARISALSIYNRAEIQSLATKYFLLTSAISGGLVIASFFLFKDTVSVLICIAFALVINNTLVSKQIDKVNLQVYKALKVAISSIRQEYMRLESVSEAVAEAEVPTILRKPMEEIHSIMTNTNGELRLYQFYESNPFRALQTLAGVCFLVNEKGDDKDSYGQSNFVSALTMLASDVNSEITRLTTMKSRFGIIEYLPLVPMGMMNILESYLMSIMPGTALIYNGIIGYLVRVITLVGSILCYNTVANINTASPIKEDDRAPWTLTMLKNPIWRQFIYDITPKNAKARKVTASLKKCLSRKGLDHLYTEKVVWASCGLVLAIIAAISTITLGRDFVLNSTQQLSLVATDEMSKYTKEQILGLDYAYFNRESEWSDDDFMEIIRGYMPGLTDLQIIDQMKRVRDKENSLKAAYFHWYYMVACIGVSIICWFAPNVSLKLRQMLVQTEAEDDFLQLQTLVAILMNTDIDTLDALWQMCQHSRIHKDMLLYCYHSYPSNPEKELVRLQSKTPIIDFRRFIGKLQLTISELSLQDAYSDLKIEREHMIRIREITIYETIDRKRHLCGIISMVPMGIFVIGDLLFPLGYLGMNEFMTALGNMRG